MIQTIGDIDTTKEEGKLLLAALAMITVNIHTDKTSEEVISMLNELDDLTRDN